VRSVFVQWSLLERDGERVLRDLGRWTTIDTIELSHVYLVWGPGDPRPEPAPPALPADGFSRLPELLRLVRRSGFSIACNLSPLFLAAPELRELGCVDASGAPVPGIHPRLPVYGCPANPEVIRLGETMARAVVDQWRPLDAVALNHLEFTVWPQSTARELATCFCDACRALATAMGIDFERVRGAARRLYEPPCDLAFPAGAAELTGWLRLRQEAVSRYTQRVVAALRDAARGAGSTLRVGLEFQLPALAPFVGTDFRRLAPLFDWMTPKFPDYLAGSVVPLVAEELASPRVEPAALRRRLRELLELGDEPGELTPVPGAPEGLLYAGAFDPGVITAQRGYVDGRVAGRPVYPYVWLYGGDLAALRAKLAAVRAAGWDGFFLWCWDSDLTSEALAAAHGIL
jgi:hypothetical protein